MSITIRPKDNYAEYEFHSYKDVDRLLDLSYGGDLDIDVFEGVLVDNFIGYSPAFAALRTIREDHQDEIYTKKHSDTNSSRGGKSSGGTGVLFKRLR